MHFDSFPRRSLFALGSLTIALTLPSAARAQTTGFLQTEAGPWDYNTESNWVGSTINGVWDSTLSTEATQTVTFGTDTALSSGLGIGYTGNFDLTFRSDGTAGRTLTLGGDINVAPVGNRTINFGSTTATDSLNVNLGGNRTFTVATSKTLNFFNTVSGGNLTISGSSPTSTGGFVKFSRSTGNAATSNITVANNATLQIDNSTNGNIGSTRAESVTLTTGGKLSVRGNNTNTVETITGSLTTDGSGSRPRSSSNNYQSISVDAGTAHTLVNLGSLERSNHGTLLVRGDNLGANTIASTTAGSSNIAIAGSAPTLIGGGGGAGTTTISITPWLVGGTNLSDSGSTFVTYTATNGLRPLDTATEFAPGFGGAATDNVRLTAATTLDTTATVNSLITGAANASLSGSGTLNVTSGAVLLTSTSNGIGVNLNFGTAEGIIGYNRGNSITGAISGSGGLTIHGNRNDESIQLLSAANTYTGDTVIIANATVANGALPFGSRTGDVYVYGNLQLNPSTYNGTINGLFGTGTVAYGNSGASSLTIGDNNATSTFDGTIAGNNNLNLTKIGSGTVTLNGENTNAKVTAILGGTLEVRTLANGGVASGIGSSAANATNLVLNGGTLKYSGATTSTDRLFQIGQTSDGGTGTIDASGSGALSFTGTGSIAYGTAGSTSVAQTRSLILTGTNTGANTLSALIGNNGSATNGNSAVSLTKSGSGTWVLTGANTYTGATTVSAGTLQVAGSIANSATTVAAGATLALSGSGTAGAVTVNSGTFQLGTAGTAGAVNINSGTFGGSGTVGSLSFSGSSVFAPGNSPGTVSIADGGVLTLSNALVSTFQFTDGSFGAGTYDLVTTAGSASATLTGTLNLEFSGSGYTAGTSVTFINLTSLTGTFAAVNVTGLSGLTASLNYDNAGGNVSLSLYALAEADPDPVGSPVPEPSSFALVAGLGALGLVGTRRRRRRV